MSSAVNATKTKQSWQEALSDLITDPRELLSLLQLDLDLLPAAEAAVALFPLKVPRGFAALMEKGNINDPLLKQVLPLGQELVITKNYEFDPLKEADKNPIPGLLHKYHGRVLITLTSACAVHCRYCFRRHFPYSDNNPGRAGWEKIVDYISRDSSISEVILSGGDPLAASDKLLKLFTDEIETIPHVKRLRVHTRLPIVLPERVTPELISWLQGLKMKPVIVLHTNHANELSEKVKAALTALRQAAIPLLNQSVLLGGVNDDVDTLANLSESLFAAGVLPYYLHTHDKVQGTAHFDLPLERAKQLHAGLEKKLPGYLLPKLVSEIPGKASKVLISTDLYTD